MHVRLVSFQLICLIYVSSCFGDADVVPRHLRSSGRLQKEGAERKYIQDWQGRRRKVEDGNYYNNDDVDEYIDDLYVRSKQYVISHANQGYHSQPYRWSIHEWIIFGVFMFAFGITFCLSCIFCVLPCCCPTATKGYVRMWR